MARIFGWFMLLPALLLSLQPSAARADTVTVAAAANIRFAMADIAKAFEQASGHRLQISYGASGNFASQLRHGAPFELFLSADEAYVAQLFDAGVTDNSGVVYAYGRLALVAAKGSLLQLDERLDGLARLANSGRLRHFALANPELAPYGERARSLLIDAGLWDRLQGKLVLGENVSQAAQFAISGAADGGLIALSLALSPQFRARANILAIPEDKHRPLAQRMVLMPGASAAAEALYEFLQGSLARQIFSNNGFSLADRPATAEPGSRTTS